MPCVTVTVRNPSGLHARPAATFVKAAAAYATDVRITNLTRDAARSASAKSILGVMGLGVSQGHELQIEADGEDAERAVAELAALVEGGLGESLPA
ncbi:MAG TPA: HPr family phosphocarrier protein [Candidatus Limnocylindria bacterium]|nr:HPr family phosphocarrier protein [Candidatus Limnocylindria bacterium]